MSEIINGQPTAADIQDYMDVDEIATALNTAHRSSDEVATSLNTTHRDSDGKNHADVVSNTTHQGSDGSDHSKVGANETAIGLNTTHRGSDGSNHSKVGANETAIGLNTTHRGSNGSNHSKVGANETAISNLEGFAGNCSMKTGTYTGNGADDRDIDIGVDLAAKTHKFVIIKSLHNTTPVARTEYSQGDLSMLFTSGYVAADLIQAFTSTGFQVGTSNNVNYDGIVHFYIAFWVD